MNDDTMEGDLMEAMNAALLEDSEHLGSLNGSNSNHSSSLHSVDVMDEAMRLLLGDGRIDGNGDGNSNSNGNDNGDVYDDDDEEEIDFERFLGSEFTNTVNTKVNDEKKDDSAPSGTACTTTNKPTTSSTTKTTEDSLALELEQPKMVPLQQFLNAMALIQDLENRVALLEKDRQSLSEENEQLRETANKQASTIADMEEKLQRFPKLLEQTVQEEAKLAASKAEAETRVSFWKKDMARQEQEALEAKRKKNRKGDMATTKSLKQSDFLKQVVDRKEQEQQEQQPQQGPRIRPVAMFQAIRGSAIRAIRNNNNSNNNNNSKNQTRDRSVKETPTMPEGEGMPFTIMGSDSQDSNSGHHHSLNFDEDEPSETNNGIDDNRKDSKVLDLMT